MQESPSRGDTAQTAWQQTAELLRSNQELREEAERMRRGAEELRLLLSEIRAGRQADRESRRAALNLMEDAVQARLATQREYAERRRAEEGLLRAAEANVFRLALSDALRPLSDAAEILATALRLLAGHLHASRVTFCELSPEGDALIVSAEYSREDPPLPGRLHFQDYDPGIAEWLRAGRPVVVDDLNNHPAYAGHAAAWQAIAVLAYVIVPLIPDGKLAATLNVCQSTPRTWTVDEIALIEDTAARLWDALARVRAEGALRTSEERHRIALEGAGMGAWDYDVASNRVIWNAQHYRLFGLEPDQRPLTPDDFLRHVHPVDLAAVQEELVTAVQGRGTYRAEFRAVRADGVMRWMSGFGQAVNWEAGQITRMTGVMFDVTERHEAEETLAAAQERLRLILESAHEHAIISLDTERRVTSWNPGAERILGYTASEITGQSLDRIHPAADLAAGLPEQEARQALQEGSANGEHWFLRKDGSALWGNCALLPMRGRPDGTVIGFVKILHDETETRQAREALERSREELWTALQETEQARAEAEAAGRAKDHFLAVLSHELRTPLTPIVMALRALSRRGDLPETVRSAHEMIQRNVQLEAHFIDDLLDVTRISHGKLEIAREEMDLHEAATRAVEVSTPDIEAKGQTLTVALDAAEHRLRGDSSRLQQALWNLLKNASKFTPSGGRISLRSHNVSPGWLVFEVTDSGIGMDAVVLEKIFNPFEQADPSITREFGGLGLGLAIAKATVEAHGGELRASSDGLDKGSVFTLSLPLAIKG